MNFRWGTLRKAQERCTISTRDQSDVIDEIEIDIEEEVRVLGKDGLEV